MKKAAWWTGIAAAVALVILSVVIIVGSRSDPLRKLVIATLEDRLNSDVELRAFSVDTYPRFTIQGEGLVLRLRGTTAGEASRPDLPPLIQIEKFTVYCGIVDLWRRPRRFQHVTLEGLVVNIPPGGLRGHGNPVSDAFKEAAARNAAPQASNADQSFAESPIIVEELRADDAMLRIIPKREGKAPREFAIHTLTMHSLGLGQAMPFEATLTNPTPKGQIQTSGTFGPWQKGNPGATPLAGRYTFAKADLSTIDGIGGLLDSTGEFAGALERIAVKGETRTPDFRLDISGQPVPLDTKFEAVVDGTDGDTYLNTVDAKFLKTSLTAKGAIAGSPGVKGRTIQLHVRIHQGRIEDLLRLSTKPAEPLIVGAVALHTDFTLPPGEGDVIQRLRLAGEFDVSKAQFSDPKVRQKIAGMSARARGLDPEQDKIENVVSDLNGKFRLHNAVLSFSELSFAIPGATVQVAGDYGLKSEELAFDGTVRMKATISQAAGGGLKGVLLKIIDPIFRKKGAGAVVPIRIKGTVDNPKVGLDVGRVFKGR
jgi:hypothetical protein